jgi:hypothetical protein
MENPYNPARAAAQRWLEKSNQPEYKKQKQVALQRRWQMSALKRRAKQINDYQAIALLDSWSNELLLRQNSGESDFD